MGTGSAAHLGRVVGEDEENEDVDNDADARDEIVGFLGDEEGVNQHVDEDSQEEDDGEGPEDTRSYQLHWCRKRTTARILKTQGFNSYPGAGDVNKDKGNKWKILSEQNK